MTKIIKDLQNRIYIKDTNYLILHKIQILYIKRLKKVGTRCTYFPKTLLLNDKAD